MTCSNTNKSKFPCRTCAKNVHDKDKAVQCDLCEHWSHIKCNNLNYLDYRYLQTCNEPLHCIECCSKIFPFNSLCDKNFLACCTNTDSSIMLWKGKKKTTEISSLLLKPTINLELLVNQFNNATPKMIMTLKILFLLNIMILMKHITLEYITKINLCPCFICFCSKCMFL